MFFNVFTFLDWSIPLVFHRRAGFSTEEKAHVDEEDDQEFADRYNCKLQRDANSFHANLLNLNELTVCKLTGNRRIIVVVYHKVADDV